MPIKECQLTEDEFFTIQYLTAAIHAAEQYCDHRSPAIAKAAADKFIDTQIARNSWFTETSAKYKLTFTPEDMWEVDFSTRVLRIKPIIAST